MTSTTDETMRLAGLCATALAGSPFARPKTWPLAVIVIRADERPIAKLRGDFAGWLRAHDLADPARECIRRQVPAGSVLVWLEVDAPTVSAAQFFTFDLRSALQQHVTSTAPDAGRLNGKKNDHEQSTRSRLQTRNQDPLTPRVLRG